MVSSSLIIIVSRSELLVIFLVNLIELLDLNFLEPVNIQWIIFMLIVEILTI